MAEHKGRRIVDVRSRRALRTWLTKNAGRSDAVWLALYKKHVKGPRLTYDEAVEELLCFGWIDSVVNKFDDDKYLLYCAPRKPKSQWSKPNKDRVDRMTAAGLMTPAGQAAIDRAKADGSWSMIDDAEALIEPDDFATALRHAPTAVQRRWRETSPGKRKAALHRLASAKRPETRAKRIAEILAAQ